MTPLFSRAFRATGTALRCVLLAGAATLSAPASARDCAGNPNALGTSRTLVVDPREHPRIGTMQYSETLPLEDREVVLTFDDGPLPKYTNQILDMLAAECVQATFFVVGEMAKAHPEGVRRIRDSGHSIGTHSETHPLSMHRMAIDKARQQIDGGITAATAALGGEAPAPFFRIPGLLRAEVVENYLAAQGLQTWSADFPADDWHRISADQVHALAMSRLVANGKGIILLHDIQPRTVGALPMILRDLKAGGYRIVHVVASRPDLATTATEPQQWRLHPVSERVAIRRWPSVPRFAFPEEKLLSAPTFAFSGPQGIPLNLPRERNQRSQNGMPAIRYVALEGATSLPVPESNLFAIAEKSGPIYQVSITVSRPSRLSEPVVVEAAPIPQSRDDIGTLIEATSDLITGGISEMRGHGSTAARIVAYSRRNPR